ncbi:MAG TPA: NUDIX hydrolase [Solirubrobacteraceae bacterium]|nr:NUDIX hydrolase [Solirubrobacteraceae bacterium]
MQPDEEADEEADVSADPPAVGQEFHFGGRTEPRPAGTVILLRGGAEALELLLVQRNPSARFMGGAWVFPGGAVERTEGNDDAAHRAAAIRELEEEAGITIADPQQLIPYSHWITPAEVKTRFDTWFYLAQAPPGAQARVDGSEVVDARWYEPASALAARERGDLFLVFPTIKHLQQLSAFSTADELLAYAVGREIHAVQPRVVRQGETARIVLPGEPGYED